jgi:hypothetical protein
MQNIKCPTMQKLWFETFKCPVKKEKILFEANRIKETLCRRMH